MRPLIKNGQTVFFFGLTVYILSTFICLRIRYDIEFQPGKYNSSVLACLVSLVPINNLQFCMSTSLSRGQIGQYNLQTTDCRPD